MQACDHCGARLQQLPVRIEIVRESGPIGLPGDPASASAKAALEVLVKSLAIELAPSGATANIVMPGYTRKDPGLLGALDAKAWEAVARANPQARLAEADEVAAAVAFLEPTRRVRSRRRRGVG